MDHPFKSPVILSLCPGILGLERGVERAIGKIRVAAYVEIEAFIIANLVAAMEAGILDPVPIWTDVKTFDAAPFRNKVHGIIGGYPCQPFSHAGLRKGEEDPRHLWPNIREIIRTAQPVWCFFENVRGHLTLGFDVVHKELSDLGYQVEAGIFSAEEVGATQKRERLFILAVEHSYFSRSEEFSKRSKNETEQPRIRNSDNELANSNSTPAVGRIGDILCTSRKNEGEAQRENRKRRRNEFQYVSEDVANNSSLGSTAGLPEQGQRDEGQPKVINDSSYRNWPAGQGSYQHEWEEPRAVKPGMGCTVNGYNFRTDLLRAYGNAVVEHTAELAFKTLLSKFSHNS